LFRYIAAFCENFKKLFCGSFVFVKIFKNRRRFAAFVRLFEDRLAVLLLLLKSTIVLQLCCFVKRGQIVLQLCCFNKNTKIVLQLCCFLLKILDFTKNTDSNLLWGFSTGLFSFIDKCRLELRSCSQSALSRKL